MSVIVVSPDLAPRKVASGHGELGSMALVAPLLVFLVIVCFVPVALFLYRAIDNSEVPSALPETLAQLRGWDEAALPHDDVFKALASDLSRPDAPVGALARRLNYQASGFRGLILKTANTLAEKPSTGKADIIAIDRRWGEVATWRLIKDESSRITAFYLLSALDLRWTDGLERVAPDQRLYLSLFARTFIISGTVTLLCLAIGFPFARLLARASTGTANILMLFVLLPFWSSVVVRTAAWIILFQSEGPVNASLQALDIIDAPLQLVFNRFGVVVAMTHVLLPFMIFPLYSTMRAIPETYSRAAAALGAGPVRAFLTVYLPQALPGVAAGCLLVFISAIGYYVTPALIGGAGDQMISYFIAMNVNQTVNWGLSAALAIMLLVAVLTPYALYAQLRKAR